MRFLPFICTPLCFRIVKVVNGKINHVSEEQERILSSSTSDAEEDEAHRGFHGLDHPAVRRVRRKPVSRRVNQCS